MIWLSAGLAAAAVAFGGATAGAGTDPASARDLTLTNTPDTASVTQYADVGFTVTVSNRGPHARAVALADALPAAGNLSWGIDRQTGVTGCATSGAVGSQRLSCPSTSLSGHASLAVHVYSHTTSSTDAWVDNTATATVGRTRLTRIATATVRPSSSCRSSQADAGRSLVFDDEFDGSSIDTTKWNVGTLPFGGYKGSTHYHNTQYGSYIEPQNSYQSDGVLNLTTDDVPVTDPDVPAIGTIPYTEGMIQSKDKFSRTGGYFEICAKFPAGRGLWPAFWLAAQNGNWPPEMDVAEWFGSIEAMQIGQPFATGPNAGSQWESTWRYSDAPTTGYHDYAMWWSPSSPGTIRYYIDGQMVHEIDGTTAHLISNTPMYLILNSGTWAPAGRGGPPDATTVFPNAFQVDYVRVYATPPAQSANSAP